MLQIYIAKAMENNFVQQLSISILGSLIGTGIGAVLAFKLERTWRQQDATKKEAQACAEVLANFLELLGFQADVWEQYVGVYANDPNAWVMLKPLEKQAARSIDAMKLSFLFASDLAPLIFEANNEESRHRQWVDALNTRSQYRAEMQKILEAEKFPAQTQWSPEIEHAAGPRVTAMLKDLTVYIIKYGAIGRDTARDVYSRLAAKLIERYPNELKVFNRITFATTNPASNGALAGRPSFAIPPKTKI
jgi:hypothetical protein